VGEALPLPLVQGLHDLAQELKPVAEAPWLGEPAHHALARPQQRYDCPQMHGSVS
jgi:hypothetical protein